MCVLTSQKFEHIKRLCLVRCILYMNTYSSERPKGGGVASVPGSTEEISEKER